MQRFRQIQRAQPPLEQSAPAHAPDYVLLAVISTLLVFGLIAVYSASYVLGYAQFDDPNYFIKRQAFWGAVGIAGLWLAMSLDYRHLLRLSPLLMVVALGALVLTLVPGIGVTQNGAHRWLGIGPLVGQPSEFAKLAVLVYMSAWLAAKGEAIRDLAMGVTPFVTMVGLVCALVIIEPDLGTTITIAAIAGVLFFVAGARVTHIAALLGVASAFTTLLVFVAGYGASRIASFASAENDPQGTGFHTLQLLIAFGSGGLFGRGLGVSRQKFFYVPGSHTDGILAIVGEELGYVGVLVVMLLFALLLWRGLHIVRHAADPFGSLLATGVLAWLSFQLLVNIGGVSRMLPLTGIPLPLLSYGGTALAATLVAIGVLLSVSRYTVEAAPARTRASAAARAAVTR